MRLGQFDTYIEVEREGVTGRDEFNAPVLGWAPVAREMAQRVQASGREFIAGDAISNDERVVFRLHWVPGLTTKDRVSCEGRFYNIHEVRPLGRNKFMELHTVGRSV